MQTYLVIGATDKVIGRVEAVDGDAAWMLARAANPAAVRLQPV